jgi:integrase
MATIRKRGDKWQARIQVKGVNHLAKTFKAKADAEAWAKVTESEIIRGTYITTTNAERTTLKEALERYEKEITPSKRGASVELFRTKAWKMHKLAQKSLASLRGADFAKWRDHRLTAASPATTRLELSVISHLFNVARKEWGYEGLTNPIESIKMPTVQNARSRLFHVGEEARLLEAMEPVARDNKGRLVAGCSNPWIKPMVILALETAMRRGELLALRWENVRIKERVAHLPITKNGSSRTVPLSSKAVDILTTLPRTLRGPVFPTTANAVNLGFPRAVKRARKKYENDGGTNDSMLLGLHFHDLRHIAVTRLAERLPNIIELAAVSGHQDVRMLKRYYHPKAEDLAMKLG